MDDQKLIWLGTFVAMSIISSSSVVAQTNQSDTTGGQTVNAPTINIDSEVVQTNQSDTTGGQTVNAPTINIDSEVVQTNQSDTTGGQTVNAPTINVNSQNANGIPPTTQLDPSTGEIVGGAIKTPVQIDSGQGEGVAVGCATTSCAEGQPRNLTIKQVAKVLDASLELSLDNLAAAEKNAELADAGPRRIARRSAVSDQDAAVCINPVYEARDVLERQLIESEKFIEQVNQIEPQKNIW